ncbi:clip-associating protein [Anaeramoeba flamelloides]|uniref:Clip-associating protein n=1 Tax=Anaeramoeba flamelloides TaxID=1746091 RepID=A0AAV7ZF51_9EUKA|nr:clip-associating protein [Anaeramoeba flamelloides]
MEIQKICQLLIDQNCKNQKIGCELCKEIIEKESELDAKQIKALLESLQTILSNVTLSDFDLINLSLYNICLLVTKKQNGLFENTAKIVDSVKRIYVQHAGSLTNQDFIRLTIQLFSNLAQALGWEKIWELLSKWFNSPIIEGSIILLQWIYHNIFQNLNDYPIEKMIPILTKLTIDHVSEIIELSKMILTEMFSFFGNPFLVLLKQTISLDDYLRLETLFSNDLVVSQENLLKLKGIKQELSQSEQTKKSSKTQLPLQSRESKNKPMNSKPKITKQNLNTKKKSETLDDQCTELKKNTPTKKRVKKKKKIPIKSQLEKESEKIPPKTIYSKEHLSNEMDQIYTFLNNPDLEIWKPRMESLIKIESFLNAGAVEYPIFKEKINTFSLTLSKQLKDLRSQIVKQCCFLIAHLSRSLKNEFSNTFEKIFEDLLQLVDKKKKVMSNNADLCIQETIRNTCATGIIPIIEKSITVSKSKIIPTKCVEYCLLLLKKWELDELKKHQKEIENILKVSFSTAQQSARKVGRKAFWNYVQKFHEQSNQFYKTLDPNTQKLLLKEKPNQIVFPSNQNNIPSNNNEKKSIDRRLSMLTNKKYSSPQKNTKAWRRLTTNTNNYNPYKVNKSKQKNEEIFYRDTDDLVNILTRKCDLKTDKPQSKRYSMVPKIKKSNFKKKAIKRKKVTNNNVLQRQKQQPKKPITKTTKTTKRPKINKTTTKPKTSKPSAKQIKKPNPNKLIKRKTNQSKVQSGKVNNENTKINLEKIKKKLPLYKNVIDLVSKINGTENVNLKIELLQVLEYQLKNEEDKLEKLEDYNFVFNCLTKLLTMMNRDTTLQNLILGNIIIIIEEYPKRFSLQKETWLRELIKKYSKSINSTAFFIRILISFEKFYFDLFVIFFQICSTLEIKGQLFCLQLIKSLIEKDSNYLLNPQNKFRTLMDFLICNFSKTNTQLLDLNLKILIVCYQNYRNFFFNYLSTLNNPKIDLILNNLSKQIKQIKQIYNNFVLNKKKNLSNQSNTNEKIQNESIKTKSNQNDNKIKLIKSKNDKNKDQNEKRIKIDKPTKTKRKRIIKKTKLSNQKKNPKKKPNNPLNEKKTNIKSNKPDQNNSKKTNLNRNYSKVQKNQSKNITKEKNQNISNMKKKGIRKQRTNPKLKKNNTRKITNTKILNNNISKVDNFQKADKQTEKLNTSITNGLKLENNKATEEIKAKLEKKSINKLKKIEGGNHLEKKIKSKENNNKNYFETDNIVKNENENVNENVNKNENENGNENGINNGNGIQKIIFKLLNKLIRKKQIQKTTESLKSISISNDEEIWKHYFKKIIVTILNCFHDQNLQAQQLLLSLFETILKKQSNYFFLETNFIINQFFILIKSTKHDFISFGTIILEKLLPKVNQSLILKNIFNYLNQDHSLVFHYSLFLFMRCTKLISSSTTESSSQLNQFDGLDLEKLLQLLKIKFKSPNPEIRSITSDSLINLWLIYGQDFLQNWLIQKIQFPKYQIKLLEIRKQSMINK